jgi:hypothetical protein
MICLRAGGANIRLLRRIENEIVTPALARPPRQVKPAGVEVRYRIELDTGTTELGKYFIPFLTKLCV